MRQSVLPKAPAHRAGRAGGCRAPARAQATGTVAGLVTDDSRRGDARRHGHVTNTATNQIRTVVTGADGFYTVPLLPPGTLQVKATLAGFKTVDSRRHHGDGRDRRSRVDLKLAVGSVEENVTVSTEAPLVETASATLGIVDRRRRRSSSCR